MGESNDELRNKIIDASATSFHAQRNWDRSQTVPQEDIDVVLEQISRLSNKYIFLNVGCYEAAALLPNGENAHINIQEPKWWYDKMLKIINNRKNLKIICNCTIVNNGKLKVFPLEFNDKINNYI